VLVYKSSRMINFALGEWIMFGALLAATGEFALGSGWAFVIFAAAAMAALALLQRRRGAALDHAPGHRVDHGEIGLGAMMRASPLWLSPVCPEASRCRTARAAAAVARHRGLAREAGDGGDSRAGLRW